MQPLRITAYLAGPLAINRAEDISLDGLLAYQVLREHFKEQFYLNADPHHVLYFARLPLEMRGTPSARVEQLRTGDVWMNTGQDIVDESLWYWSCSTAQIAVKARDTQYWNKRFDTQAALSDHIDFGGKVQKIIIEQGRYKAYHMPLSTVLAEKIAWYAYGDLDAITRLLTPIATIGKKRSQGFGGVLRWEIVPMQEDWSEWWDGRLMRPIPGPLASMWNLRPPLDMQFIAYRPPQWHHANQVLCVTKGVRT